MSGMLSLAPKDTQAAELAQATNALPGRNAHMLAQAQRALKQGLLPLLSVQVCHPLLWSLTYLLYRSPSQRDWEAAVYPRPLMSHA